MALRSPTSFHSNWGSYSTVSLPTSADVQVGDTAFDTDLGQLVVCTAIGPVVWTAVGGGGGGSTTWIEPAHIGLNQNQQLPAVVANQNSTVGGTVFITALPTGGKTLQMIGCSVWRPVADLVQVGAWWNGALVASSTPAGTVATANAWTNILFQTPLSVTSQQLGTFFNYGVVPIGPPFNVVGLIGSFKPNVGQLGTRIAFGVYGQLWALQDSPYLMYNYAIPNLGGGAGSTPTGPNLVGPVGPGINGEPNSVTGFMFPVDPIWTIV
jgi:hypothetical protein